MFFILKTILLIVAIFVGSSFIIQHLPSLQAQIIQLVNPPSQQTTTLHDLGTTLDQLNQTNAELATSKSSSETQATLQKQYQLIQKSHDLSKKVEQEQKTGITGITNQLAAKIIDLLLGTPK